MYNTRNISQILTAGGQDIEIVAADLPAHQSEK